MVMRCSKHPTAFMLGSAFEQPFGTHVAGRHCQESSVEYNYRSLSVTATHNYCSTGYHRCICPQHQTSKRSSDRLPDNNKIALHTLRSMPLCCNTGTIKCQHALQRFDQNSQTTRTSPRGHFQNARQRQLALPHLMAMPQHQCRCGFFLGYY